MRYAYKEIRRLDTENMIDSIKEAIKERENNYPGDEYYYDNPECALNDADFWYQACRHLMGLEVEEPPLEKEVTKQEFIDMINDIVGGSDLFN